MIRRQCVLSGSLPRDRSLKEYLYEACVATPRHGRYVFDYDWDLVIILDACRYDLAQEYSETHDTQLGDPDCAYAVGSTSRQWLKRTFANASTNQLSGTAYITANVFSNYCPDNIKAIDRVWQYAWDEDLETVPPRPVTDQAIKAMRNDIADRYIVHYMQPHLPPVQEPNQEINGWRPVEANPGAGRSGGEWRTAIQTSSESIQNAIVNEYRENLAPVMSDVELLLENVDAESVIITADHGNFLGENDEWGHPPSSTHAAVRHVPWWETTATNEQTHTPESHRDTESSGSSSSSMSQQEKLAALGYAPDDHNPE